MRGRGEKARPGGGARRNHPAPRGTQRGGLETRAVTAASFTSRGRRVITTAKLHVFELDVPAFGLESDIAAGHLAVVPPGRDAAVDPQRHVLALAGAFVGVPRAGLLAPLRHLVGDVYALLRAVNQSVAEEVADVLAADLRLVPDRPVGGVAHIHAAVVALLAVDLLEAPLDVKDAVPKLLVVQEHLVDADAAQDHHFQPTLVPPGIPVPHLPPRRN